MVRRTLTSYEKEIARKLKLIFLAERESRKFSQDSAASAMGWSSQSTVGQYLNGKIPLNTDAKLKFAKFLGVKVTDFDPKFREDEIFGFKLGDVIEAPTKDVSESINDNIVVVQQYRNAALSAGAGALNDDAPADSEMYFKRSWLQYKGWKPSDLFVIYIKGESMQPRLHPGDVVLINKSMTKPVSGSVYAINVLGESKIKRLYTDMKGGITVKSDNHEIPDEYFSPEEVNSLKILGKCVWVGSEYI